MDGLSTDLIVVLNWLLPGFVAAWIFYGLSGHSKPSPFERVVQALVYNVIIQPFVIAIRFLMLLIGRIYSFGDWTVSSETFYSVIIAVIIGTFFAGLANGDVVHSWLRLRNWNFRQKKNKDSWMWTWNTSAPSEWYSALSRRDQYIVLHLTGERRLWGWPDEWPDEPDRGHFVISEAEWLLENDKRIPLEPVEAILIPASSVEMIEFVKSVSGGDQQPTPEKSPNMEDK